MLLVLCLALASRDENNKSRDSSSDDEGLGISDSACSLETGTDESFVVRCVFTETQYPISLQDLLTLASEEAVGIGEIEADSEIWIEASGGDGARGANFDPKHGGAGGSGGYARWGGTIQELQDNILLDEDGDSLYILVGQKGETGFNTTGDGGGGSGGSSSLVIGQDLRRIRDELDPYDELVVLIAGGGGGGGKADQSLIPESGKAGGAGGDATSTIFNDQSGAGSDGKGSRNGKGGNQDGKGGGGDGHVSQENGASGIGGFGGSVNGTLAGWEGFELTWEFGNGGESSSNQSSDLKYSGGSGGGGYGGGGGASCCDGVYLNTGYGGGGGGSWVRQAVISDENDAVYLGKDNMPDNDGDGIVVISIGVIFNSSITIVEELSSGAQSASFTGSGFLDYCSQMYEFALSNGQSISCALEAGQITITQEVPDESNISINCVGNSPWSVTNRAVEIDLENNDDMVCTFTNALPQGPTTVFITGNTYTGQLGGLDGADDLCNTLAAGSGLDGYFRAWLSDSTGSPSTRFTKSTFPYLLVDGTQIAEDWTDLTTCDTDCLDNIINLSENGDNVVEIDQTFAWTGTASDGALENSNYTCNNWTSGSSDKSGLVGGVTNKEFWTSVGFGFVCSSMEHLYCFEQ